MSEANGTTHASEATEEVKPANRLPRQRKAKAESTGTGAFYERMGKLCAKKALTLTASDTEGKVTVSITSFPAFTKDAIAEAAKAGVKVAFIPTDLVDGKTAAARGSAEGEAGAELVEEFFGIPNQE